MSVIDRFVTNISSVLDNPSSFLLGARYNTRMVKSQETVQRKRRQTAAISGKLERSTSAIQPRYQTYEEGVIKPPLMENIHTYTRLKIPTDDLSTYKSKISTALKSREELSKLKKPELIAYAKRHGISIKTSDTKPVIIDKILASQHTLEQASMIAPPEMMMEY
jgi:hypothetical protein